MTEKLTRPLSLGLAAGVFIITSVLGISYGAYDASIFVNTAIGCAMVILMVLSWTYSRQSIVKSVLPGMAAILITCLTFYSDMDSLCTALIILSMMLVPTLLMLVMDQILSKKMPAGILKALISGIPFCMAVVVWGIVAEKRADLILIFFWLIMWLLWGYALNSEECSTAERQDYQWKTWLINLVLAFIFLLFRSESEFRILTAQFWRMALQLCLPVICYELFRWVNQMIAPQTTGRTVKIAGMYFGAALLLYLLVNITDFHNLSSFRFKRLELGVYTILIVMMIYVAEMKKIRGNEESGHFFSILFGAIYTIGCLAMTFLRNNRLSQMVLYFSDKTAKGRFLSYLQYRFTAIKCFITGNMDALSSLPVSQQTNNCFLFVESSTAVERLGVTLYRAGWWCLIMITVIVITVAVILFKTKWKDERRNSLKKYLAVSYLIRLVMALYLTTAMYTDFAIQIPFCVNTGMDLAILFLLLMNWKRKDDPEMMD